MAKRLTTKKAANGKTLPRENIKIEDSGLTIKQEEVAVALAMGLNIEDISKTHDVARSRIYEWRKQPEFSAHLKRLQREVVREIRGRLSQMSDTAIERIREIMEGGGEQASLKAACYVLDFMAGEQREAKKMRLKMKAKDGTAR